MNSEPNATDELRPFSMNRVYDLFDGDELPATTDEIVDLYGDVVVEYSGGGTESLESILNTSGKETYRNADDLQLAILNGVRRSAVGRPRYSDRDPPVMGEERNPKVSF
ncbi:DUF2795 domain-containing protein [Haladaptatus halobius]|jgi:hypothetical protein|uniref:DUF5789 family protein n=1 Tax=Haladaptatus halobius TaxID=2884875 RepID=UPI001D0B9688|nr:DUF2795 domain-containing protein [Haladaptatus halobius]